MRVAGWCLSVLGGGPIALLVLVAFASDDIALTYLLGPSILLGAAALVAITVGVVLIWAGRIPTQIPTVSRVTDRPTPER